MARSLWLERCVDMLDAGLRLAPFILALLMLCLATVFLLGESNAL